MVFDTTSGSRTLGDEKLVTLMPANAGARGRGGRG